MCTIGENGGFCSPLFFIGATFLFLGFILLVLVLVLVAIVIAVAIAVIVFSIAALLRFSLSVVQCGLQMWVFLDAFSLSMSGLDAVIAPFDHLCENLGVTRIGTCLGWLLDPCTSDSEASCQ